MTEAGNLCLNEVKVQNRLKNGLSPTDERRKKIVLWGSWLFMLKKCKQNPNFLGNAEKEPVIPSCCILNSESICRALGMLPCSFHLEGQRCTR